MLSDPQGREQCNYRSFRPRLDHGDDAIRVLPFGMEENAAFDMSLSALAPRAAMSERTLQRRFGDATGLPLGRYVQALRVEKARGLLKWTPLPISDICWVVGYSDVSAFSRLFKSICGVTAGEYRPRFSVR
jgi:transcriptional regulator GlxA family with amidase domain